jgi:hypothetical protein
MRRARTRFPAGCRGGRRAQLRRRYNPATFSMTRGRRRIVLVLLVLLMAGFYGVFVATPEGPRSLRAFDPDRTAALELDMWQAYYAGRNIRLFSDLVTLNHEQYKYTWARASQVGYHLARAASTFARIRDNYDQVLPDLERAYAIAKDWTRASFDPAAVARAELAWWVARRVPGQDSPEQVGGLIADLNALLYGVPRERVLEASVLRARAGRLRDEGGERANWAEVGRLLKESYRALHAAVQ